MILIVDYGMGNLRSVAKAFELYHHDVKITSNPRDLYKAKAVVLPGDGAFAMAMENIKNQGWLKPLKNHIESNGYFMGICLGFQLLAERSFEFGETPGLGVARGKVVKFPNSELKIPHLGWNEVKLHGKSKFLKGIPSGSYFYFIHSYRLFLEDSSWLLGSSHYGDEFPCIIGQGNAIATQFHPEKSHKMGLKIIENFVQESCSSKKKTIDYLKEQR